MKISRREFAAKAAMLATTTLMVSETADANPMGEPLGFQTYELIDHLVSDWNGTWEKMASCGYKVADILLFSFEPRLANRTTKDYADALKQNGLTCINGHLVYQNLTQDYAGSIKWAHELGLKSVVCAFLEQKPTVDGYKQIADQLNELARKLQGDGLRLGYHNHEVEFRPVEGQIPWDILVTHTDPKLVGFQIDVGNLTFGGGNAVEYLSKYPGRYYSMHCKDFLKGQASVPVGQGSLDWKKLFASARKQNIRSYVAEVGAYGLAGLDGTPLRQSPIDVLESFRQSAEFLKKIK